VSFLSMTWQPLIIQRVKRQMITLSPKIPLPIMSVSIPKISGRIGMSSCPGRKGPSLVTGYTWKRNLPRDLQTIAAWGASVVVTLLDDDEIKRLGITAIKRLCAKHQIEWLHLPIFPCLAPDAWFEREWTAQIHKIETILRSGRNIHIHCQEGLGRTGTVAARLLCDFGLEPDDAIRMVRQANPGAIETCEQEEYLLNRAWLIQRHRPGF
ncbi:MAG: dual specificity protein phosphatase family protein, partial [Desulfuromonadaceae bacterium]|nr:dual specificity protein phosphatase family protein [Desulfuromonadaceae bacterium]